MSAPSSDKYDDRSLPVQIAAAQYAANVAERHYNLHAAGSGKGPKVEKTVTKQLSEFHNKIKRNLIEFNTRSARATHHLDIACGRGGDIDKWAQAGLRFVLGVDVSPNEIKYARMRYANYTKGSKLNCMFEATRDVGMRALQWPIEFPMVNEQFDSVSCMFAAHYFFVSEYSLDCFLSNVASALKHGGIFYGALPLAPRVVEFLGGQGKNSNSVLEIQKRWDTDPKPVGATYTFNLKESVTGAAAEESESVEYLVYPDVFTRVAARHGLYPMKDTDPLNYFTSSDPEQRRFVDGNYEVIDGHPEFRYFRPTYEGESARDLETVSRLNAAFVFIRISNAVVTPLK